MINLGINGAAGRMGRLLIQLAQQDKAFKLVLALESAGHPDLGKDIGLVAGLGRLLGVKLIAHKEYKQNQLSHPQKADVMIDFSLLQAVPDCLEFCRKNKIALVEGTTGLSPRVITRIKQMSKIVPCLVSPNFSRGANLLMGLAGAMARQVGKDYDIEIVEAHHRTKKDKPSGTALKLAGQIKDALKDQKRVIPMHSLRIGEVVGEHKVIFGGPGEVIELVHRVQSRNAFAAGALEAAKFLAQVKPGFYNLKDILADKDFSG